MAYNEDEYLQLSGIQHFRFCRRQWALIHIENLWAENVRTVDGELMHERAHDSGLREKRAGVIVTRDLAISSPTLGASGACDVVEFRKSADGIPLPGEEGRFRPYPVEYKHGSPREDLANELGRSTSYVRKHFQKDVGMTVGEFVIRSKLEEAKTLLVYSEKTLAEISFDLCFSSQSYFQRLFKKEYGITPAQYRKQGRTI